MRRFQVVGPRAGTSSEMPWTPVKKRDRGPEAGKPSAGHELPTEVTGELRWAKGFGPNE